LEPNTKTQLSDTLIIIDYPSAFLKIPPLHLIELAKAVDVLLLGRTKSLSKAELEAIGCMAADIECDTPSDECIQAWRNALLKIAAQFKSKQKIIFVTNHFWKFRAASGTRIQCKYVGYMTQLAWGIMNNRLEEVI